MGLINKLKNWLIKPVIEGSIIPKTLQTLEIFDSVWVELEGIIYDGWVYDITKTTLCIIYNGNEELKVRYTRPLDKTFIKDNSCTVYFNEIKNGN